MMKSSDIEKSKKILDTINYLGREIEFAKRIKKYKLSISILREGKSLWLDKEISQNVIDMILKKLNSKKEEHIRKLEEFGVEYVE